MSRTYQRCTRCIMDTSDPSIEFDEQGWCNHCRGYDELSATQLLRPDELSARLEEIVAAIKLSGAGKPYDCLIGVSGGVDSTYVAYLARKLGLRPLAVHLDNGWDAELAVSNIEKVLHCLEIDLHTHVLDWEQFKDLQLSFLRASVPDGEIPTDHAIAAVIYATAARLGIRYVISGSNVVTEGILPRSWTYGIMDWTYIRAIHRRFGAGNLATFPHMSLVDRAYFNFVKQIKTIRILNFIPYSKQEVMRVLEDELGWKYYGGKHYESIYTRFFQGYLLPRKFGIDKRLAHYSTLICSGQMTRAAALKALEEAPYPESLQEEDLQYVTKKLSLAPGELDALMALPIKRYHNYPNESNQMDRLRRIMRVLQKFGLLRGNTSL